MAIQVLGFPTTLGLPRHTNQHAPAALRSAGLLDSLRQLSMTVEDFGDMPLAEGDRTVPVAERVRRVVAAAQQQADLWLRAHKPGHLMMTLGGDHTTSLGTIMALTRMGHQYDVVWIDAHGDFNIMETSPSGNPHGMVLSLACGLMPAFMPAVTHPSNLQLWGIRDLDPGERDLLNLQAVEVLGPEQVRRDWDRIIRRLKPNLLLSFDMDSIEPDHAPGTMTPVPNGFRRDEALELVSAIARQRNILAMDLVEFHPDRDQGTLTRDLAVRVLTAAVKGQAERRSSGRSAAAGI